ncbi:hypothetical protein UL72_26000, partial [Shigella dysenteriae]
TSKTPSYTKSVSWQHHQHRTEGVQDVRYGYEMYYNPGSNTVSWTFRSPSGHGLSGISISDTGRNSADNVN